MINRVRTPPGEELIGPPAVITPPSEAIIPPKKKKKKREGMISVSPVYAKQHPESVTEIDGKFYRPAVSATESRLYKRAGLTSPEVLAKKLTPEGQFELAKITREVPREAIFVPGEAGEEWTFTTPIEQLKERSWLEGIKAEASGLPSQENLKPPRSFRGDMQRWNKYALEALGGNEAKFRAWKKSGLLLSSFVSGTSYGPGLAEQMGLEPYVGYNMEKLKPWFDKLEDYKIFNEQNRDKLRRFQYWVRGAQLGLSPEDYIAIAERLDKLFAIKEFPARAEGFRPETLERLRGFQEKVLPSRETILERMTDTQKYLFGLTDEAPEGYKSIPKGASIRWSPRAPPVEAKRQTAQEWFKETYPSIAGERGGARPTQRWPGIFTGSGRHAPKIKTLTF